MKLLILNGPNLNLLGEREPGVYGTESLADVNAYIQACIAKRNVTRAVAGKMPIDLDFQQDNGEGALIDIVQQARLIYDGIAFNPGAYTHYSYALHDAIKAISIPVVEVHLSDIDAREPFRAISVTKPACIAQVVGKGKGGYVEAVDLLVEAIEGGETMTECGNEPAARGNESAAEEANEPAAEEANVSAARGNVSTPREDESATDRRLARLRSRMEEEDLSAYLATSTTDIHWLTGFDGVFDEERAHAALVTAGDAWLKSDTRYSEVLRARAQGTCWEIDDERRTYASYLSERLHELVTDAAQGFDAAASGATALTARIGIEHDLPLDEYRLLLSELAAAGFGLSEGADAPALGSELVECKQLVFGLRAVKDADELARHREAQRITDEAFARTLEAIRPGQTEKHIASLLEFNMRDLGADGLAFSSIIASGPHSSMPHALPSAREIQDGDFIVRNFGAAFAGYRAVMTPGRGAGDAGAARDLRRTLEAHEQWQGGGQARSIPAEIHALAERIIADAGYAGCFTHGLGHGVGLDIHEMPFVSPKNKVPLVPGNVITIEPGIYVPGVCGVRIEDFGVVTQDGFESFARSPHELIEL